MTALVKLHGLGNDFLVLLDDGGDLPADMPAFARAACDRHEGVGADGLIVCRRTESGGATAFSFHLWNADGGEAEMSGNGMRCAAHAALDAGWVTEGVRFGVITAAGRREVTLRRTGPASVWAEVAMGTVKVLGAGGACNINDGTLRVDVGNPHLVVLGPDPAVVDVPGLGAELERSEPSGTNVEFVTLGPGPDVVTMRVWERGVGETQACGTGACAAAAAMHHWGRVGSAVTVVQPGGSLAVRLLEDGTATLSGPSVRIAACYLARKSA